MLRRMLIARIIDQCENISTVGQNIRQASHDTARVGFIKLYSIPKSLANSLGA